jgi:hypothetical protein
MKLLGLSALCFLVLVVGMWASCADVWRLPWQKRKPKPIWFDLDD